MFLRQKLKNLILKSKFFIQSKNKNFKIYTLSKIYENLISKLNKYLFLKNYSIKNKFVYFSAAGLVAGFASCACGGLTNGIFSLYRSGMNDLRASGIKMQSSV